MSRTGLRVQIGCLRICKKIPSCSESLGGQIALILVFAVHTCVSYHHRGPEGEIETLVIILRKIVSEVSTPKVYISYLVVTLVFRRRLPYCPHFQFQLSIMMDKILALDRISKYRIQFVTELAWVIITRKRHHELSEQGTKISTLKYW
jgi:hypothetical protein